MTTIQLPQKIARTRVRFPNPLDAAVPLNSLVIPMKPQPALDSRDQRGRHLIFLHGLFGSANSFRFLAKKREIQEQFTVHVLDMRNHGESSWSHQMDYKSMAYDILRYMHSHGLTQSPHLVSLVGHSMGGKTAMTFA